MRALAPVVVAAAMAATAFAADGGSVLLRNGTVHSVSAPDISSASVLIVDGKIAKVGRKLPAPRGAEIVDLKGLHVYPGMIDSGTEIGLSEIGAVRETGDTRELGDFNPQLRALVAVNPDSDHIPVTRANGITSVVTGPSGGIISGQAALVHLDGWTWEEMRVKETAGMSLQFPTLRVGRSRFSRSGGAPATFKEAEKQYRERLRELDEFFEESRRYRTAKAAGRPDFESDVKFEAMLGVLEGRTKLIVFARRKREIRAALDFAEKQKVRIILAQPVQVRGFLEEIARKQIPVITGPTLALPLEEDDSYDSLYSLPAALHNAGVQFAFATFSTSKSRNLPYQAAMSVGFGLPKEEALKSVTLTAAEIWGVADRLGSIEEGKLADLIVTDGDPLETRTQIKHLFINGRHIDPNQNKQYELYERYRDRK